MKNLFKITHESNRIFGLDILRACAILFVVIEHAGNLLPYQLARISNLFVFDGVSIFFVLSGFLIGGILIRQFSESASKKLLIDFWIRRWMRTLPNYFLILLLLCFLHTLFDAEFKIQNTGRYFIFSQNLFQKHPRFFPEAWSLSVEEWFYLLIPILLYASIRFFKMVPSRALLAVTMVVLTAITCIRFYVYVNIPILDINDVHLLLRKQVITRLDSIMYGIIGAYIFYYHPRFWNKFKLQVFIIGVCLFLFQKFISPNFFVFNGLYQTVFSFAVTAIATLFLLPFLNAIASGSGKIFELFTLVSLISYSMYLVNLTLVQRWIIDHIPWDHLIENYYLLIVTRYILYWLLVITISIILFKYFEKPVMKLRDKISR